MHINRYETRLVMCSLTASELAQQTVITTTMHEDVKCFDPLPVKIQLKRRVLMVTYVLGFSELFRKFFAAEVYSEVAKMYLEEFILPLMEGQNGSLELFPGCALGT